MARIIAQTPRANELPSTSLQVSAVRFHVYETASLPRPAPDGSDTQIHMQHAFVSLLRSWERKEVTPRQRTRGYGISFTR